MAGDIGGNRCARRAYSSHPVAGHGELEILGETGVGFMAGSHRKCRSTIVVHRFLRLDANPALLGCTALYTVSSSLDLSGNQYMVWSEESILRLRDLWDQGLSTAEIGRRLGVSKNAIVGKAHRLDLTARPSPIRREPSARIERPAAPARLGGPTLPPLPSATVTATVATVQVFRPAPVVPAPRPVLPPPPAVVAPPPMRAIAMPPAPRRSAPACCWPIGEPGKKDFRFCDDASVPGKPYCDEHAKLAYVKIRDRKEDAA